MKRKALRRVVFGFIQILLIGASYSAVRSIGKASIVVTVDNNKSTHPVETVKNPEYLSKYISEGLNHALKSHSRSLNLYKFSTLCRYSLDIASQSIYYCRLSVSSPLFIEPDSLMVGIPRLWIPRYSQERDHLFISFQRYPNTSETLTSPEYIDYLGDGPEYRKLIVIKNLEYSTTLGNQANPILILILVANACFILILLLAKLFFQKTFSFSRTTIYQFIITAFLLELLTRFVGPSLISAYPHLEPFLSFKLIRESLARAHYHKSLKGFNPGASMREYAWAATYRDFNLKTPPGGRREEFYGEKLQFSKPCGKLSICWSSINNQAIQIDSQGYQYSDTCKSMSPRDIDIIVIGGSVAEGAHASFTHHTWWHHFARTFSHLQKSKYCLGVLALGGAESDWELEALKTHLTISSPKIIVALDGLNDIVKKRSSDSRILAESVDNYNSNIAAMAAIANSHDSLFVHAIQPGLFDKQHLSTLEKLLLPGYLPDAGSDWTAPGRIYKPLIASMSLFASRLDWHVPGYISIDLSNSFALEQRTLFGDIWHFQDPGHKILGDSLAYRLYRRLNYNPNPIL